MKMARGVRIGSDPAGLTPGHNAAILIVHRSSIYPKLPNGFLSTGIDDVPPWGQTRRV
jgi:hypothetical protein